MTPALRRLTIGDAPRLRQLWTDEWAGDTMIVHGEVFRPEQLEGFVADDWAGVVTYLVRDGECEIISLNSLEPNRGDRERSDRGSGRRGPAAGLPPGFSEHDQRQSASVGLLSTSGLRDCRGASRRHQRDTPAQTGDSADRGERNSAARRDRARNAPVRRVKQSRRRLMPAAPAGKLRMRLRHLSLTNFRNFARLDLKIPRG